MAIEEALTALLSGVADGRRWWRRAPQSNAATPFLILHAISRQRGYHYEGPDGYFASRFQIDIKGATFTEVVTARRAIEAALDGFSGSQSGTHIQGVFIEGPVNPATEAPGGASYPFSESLDLIVHHD